MEATEMQVWIAHWGPIVTLASTVLLLTVTTWYAVLTRSIAEACKSAAEHARIAAEATLATVAAAEATAEVDFELRPDLASTLGEVRQLLERAKAEGVPADADASPLLTSAMRLEGVEVVSRGAAVYVHGARLDGLGREDEGNPRVISSSSEETAMVSGESLPKRVHKGEAVAFSLPRIEPGKGVAELDLTLTYSFGASGQQYERRLEWRKSTGATAGGGRDLPSDVFQAHPTA